jgi:phenylacetate-CoA ligase
LSGALQISDEMFGVREFQSHQDTPGRATLRVVPLAGAAPDFEAYLRMFNRKAGAELTLSLEVLDRIPTTPRGKRKFIDQRLDLARAGRAAGLGYGLAEVEAS